MLQRIVSVFFWKPLTRKTLVLLILILQKRAVFAALLEVPPGFGPGIKVLQTFALPLGDGTIKIGAVDETRTRDLHLGKVALYQLSYYRKTGAGRNRTTDTEIFSLLLYLLSYRAISDPNGARTHDLQRDRLAF